MKKTIKSKEEILSDYVYDTTVGIAKRNKRKLPTIYGEEFAEYFLEYCKENGVKNVKTKKQALEILNKDFIKGVQGSLIPVVKKKRSLNKSYVVFQDVCAFCRLKMKEKYGEFNYYEMEKSKNKKAREEYARFEEWADKTRETFEQHKVDTKAIINGKSPNDLLNQSMIPGFIGIGGGLIAFDALYAFWTWASEEDDYVSVLIILGMGIGLVSLGYFMDPVERQISEKEFAKNNNLDQFFQQFGFKDRHEGYDYLNDYISVMPQAEKQALIDAIIENQKLTTAHTYGFSSIQEAIDAANATAGTKNLTLDEALQIQAVQYSNAQDSIAKKYGISDYKSAVDYLNSHKILKGETEFRSRSGSGAGWSVYDYDDPNAKVLAQELSKLDTYQANAVNSVKSQTWPQEVVDYGDLNQMMYEMKSTDIIKQVCYDHMLSSENYGYGVDNLANGAYSDLVDRIGVDNANKYAEIPVKPNTLGSEADLASGGHSFSISDALDASMLWLAGAGFIASATLRSVPGIKALHTNSKKKKLVKKIAERDEQIAQDEMVQRRK